MQNNPNNNYQPGVHYPNLDNQNPQPQENMYNPNFAQNQNYPQNMQNNQYNPNFPNPQSQNQQGFNQNLVNYKPQGPYQHSDSFHPSNQATYDNNSTNPLMEADDGDQFSFQKANVRMGFIRKVYLILCTQLLLTATLGYLAMYNYGFSSFLSNNTYLIPISSVLTIITSYSLFCYSTCARKVPLNFIMLFIFTISEAVIVSFIVMNSKEENVILALIMAAAVTVGLTIYAMVTKSDFTMCGGLLFILCFVLIGASILNFFLQSPVFKTLISVCGAILFGLYLIFDTQLIVGGKQHELSVDDYIVGALALYIDIIQIFLQILSILEN